MDEVINMEQPPQRRRRYNPEPDKTPKKKSDKLLNGLIAIVSVLILIVGYNVLTYEGSSKNDKEEAKVAQKAEKTAEQKAADDKAKQEAEKKADLKKDITERSTVRKVEVADENVEMAIVDDAWQPLKTAQTEAIGEDHISQYDGASLDWTEKVTELATVSNIPEEEMRIIRVKNGGSNQKTIGVVTSADGLKMYRIYLEWVPNKGWTATQLDVLKTLNGTY